MAEHVITKITVQKRDKQRYNLFINGVYRFAVHEDVLVRHQLRKGLELSEEALVTLLQDEEKQKAYVDALNLLSFRPRTAKEMAFKLKEKEYAQEIIETTINKLLERKLIDDRLFAKQWVEERSANKGKGALILRQELLKKGVDKHFIDEALMTLDDEEQTIAAMELAMKRLQRYKHEEWMDIYRKIGGFLSRRGYHSGIVSHVLSQVKQEWQTLREDDSFS